MVFAFGAVQKRIRPRFGPIWSFQNHAPHPSRKHILDFQRFSCRCKCNMHMFCSPYGPFRIRTLARDLCTIIVQGPNCTHTSVRHIHFFANSSFSKTMLPARAGSTLSISRPFHTDTNATLSCLCHYMGLSIRVLAATWAFQESCSRSGTVGTYRPSAAFGLHWAYLGPS